MRRLLSLAEPARTAFAVSLVFGTTSAILGVHMPYLPVWLDWVGLSPSEIALLGSVPLFVRVVATPLAGFYADRWGRPALFVVLFSWATFAAFAVLAQGRSFPVLLAATILFACAWTPVLPLAEAVSMSAVRRSGLDYGRMRLWGSITFIATNVAGGWMLERLGAPSIVWLIGGLCLLSAIAAGMLLTTEASTSAGGGGTTVSRRISLGDLASLARRRSFLLFLLASGAVQSAHAVFYVFGILHWRATGISAEWAGALWAVSIVVEVLLFAYSRSVVERIGPVQLIVLGCVAAIVRWTIMGLDPSLLWLIPLQMAHALTYGASHLGAFHYMSRTVPEHQLGTAQAIHAAVAGGIANGLVILSIGPLYANFGGRAYWAMTLVALVGLLAALGIERPAQRAADQPHSSGAEGKTRAPS